MKPDEIKNSIKNIEPDFYLESRLSEKVIEAAPKRKDKRKLTAAVSFVLCLAVLIAGIGFGVPRKNADENKNPGSTVGTDASHGNYMFIMSVAAQENDDSGEKTYIPIDDDTLTLPDYKLSAEYDENGEVQLHGHSESALSVSGENIKSVRYISELSALYVVDWDLMAYLKQNDEYFDVIVPYSDEYKGKTNPDGRLDFMMRHIKAGDYDRYFTKSEKKSRSKYMQVDDVYYEDIKYYGMTVNFDLDESNIDDLDIVGLGLVSKETYERVFPGDGMSAGDYTFENVLDKTSEIGAVAWEYIRHESVDVLFENPELPLSQLPHDTLTVEVTFDDGTVQTAKYDLGLNDDGLLVINKL